MDVYSDLKIKFMERILDEDLTSKQIESIGKNLDYILADYDIVARHGYASSYGKSFEKDLENYFIDKQIKGLAKGTINNKKVFFQSFSSWIGVIPTKNITTSQLEKFLIIKEDHGVRSATINEYRGYFNDFFEWAMKHGIVEMNVAEDVLKRKEPKKLIGYLKREEIDLIREYADPMDRLYIEFMYATGARVSDMIQLKIDDISPSEDDRSIYTVHIMHGKGDKERYALLNSAVKMQLDRYLSSRKDDSPYLFVSERGHHPITTAAIRGRMKRLSRKIYAETGIEVKMNPHMWRHTYATTLLRNGMDITSLQQMLGHSSLNTTQIYAQQSLSNAIRDYSRFMN